MSSGTNTFNRIFELEGIYNLRDIGGYATQSGDTTRWRRFLRSDSLHTLTPASSEAILATGLRTIIDLRRPDEAAAEPDLIATAPNIKYLNLPILTAAVSSSENTNAMQSVQSLEQVYQAFLGYFKEPMKTVFTAIADNADEPVLIHCSAGKDRTGVVIAVLLKLAGVDDQTVIDDYAITGERLKPIMHTFRQKAIMSGLDLERHEKMLESRPEIMETTLKFLQGTFGGAEPYLQHIGITSEQINKLRTALID